MAMSYIWSGLVILSFLWGFFHGNLSAVAAAALDGAQSALELSLSMAGILCLWSGVMEILNVCGLSRRIAALFRPLLRRLLPNASRDEETLAAVSANVSANLLGIPAETVPLMLVRPVSGSGALAVASDLMAAHGPDSYIGRVAAVMLGSTETTFYTIAVYFGSAGIVRTRHTVPAALAADLTGFLTAALTVRLLFGP